jgi:hypothetical protein
MQKPPLDVKQSLWLSVLWDRSVFSEYQCHATNNDHHGQNLQQNQREPLYDIYNVFLIWKCDCARGLAKYGYGGV